MRLIDKVGIINERFHERLMKWFQEKCTEAEKEITTDRVDVVYRQIRKRRKN